jgi:hypothetical protein
MTALTALTALTAAPFASLYFPTTGRFEMAAMAAMAFENPSEKR